MKLDCPHCGDSFTYDPAAGGRVFNCRHCGLPIQLPTVDQLPPDKLQELQAENQAVERKAQRQAERAEKKAEAQRRREEYRQQQQQRLQEQRQRQQQREQQWRQQQAQESVQEAPSASPPPIPSLLACPDCGRGVSPHAPACPNCGHPMAAQTVEQTSKKYKAMQLFGFLGMVAGLMILFMAGVTEVGMFLSIFAVLGGLLLLILGRALAWWFHG